jgi:hypothetical protein
MEYMEVLGICSSAHTEVLGTELFCSERPIVKCILDDIVDICM